MMRAQIEVIPCKICGDKSSGVHYGVITCEGCKGFFRRSQLPTVSYSCSRQSHCQIDRASRNRCQHCRLQKCLAQGMSRDAVKFGRMSKRQRDSLFAEVARHRQQQQQEQQQQQQRHAHCDLLRPKMQRHNSVGHPPLLQPGSVYPFPTGEVAELLPYPAEVHSYLVFSPGESQASGEANHHHHRSASLPPVTRTQGRGDGDGRGYDSRRASPDLGMEIRTCDHLDELFAPYPHTLKNIDELCSSVVRAHRDTSQFTAEDLNTLRWKVFSIEEIHQYQNKSVDEMWAWCSVRVTEAVQFVVEFAKHLPGFRLLSQNDQIALLKTGSMEVVLVRMSRLFNTDNSTVFFDGKFAGAELFKSLGCGDLITAVFDFAHGMCALRLTEQQVALFTALVLINTDRPCLEDRAMVQRVQRELELGLTHILSHTHTHEGLVSKLHQRMAVLRSLCRLHVEKLRAFMQRFPLTVQRLFPPLYRELFVGDAEPPATSPPPPGGAH